MNLKKANEIFLSRLGDLKVFLEVDLTEEQIKEIVYAAFDLGTLTKDDLLNFKTIKKEIDWKYEEQKGGLWGNGVTDFDKENGLI